jgi:PAS domain S-box-containing protein
MTTSSDPDDGRPERGGASRLRHNDQLFRLLVERIEDYAIFGLDPEGVVVSWNAGAERIKGYPPDAIIGQHFSRFYDEAALAANLPMRLLQEAAERGRVEDEGWRQRADGTRFWANVVITALRDDAGRLIGYAKVTRDLTERKRLEQLETDARQVSEFVAVLAHELRGPLAPIRQAAGLGRHGAADATKIEFAFEVIDRQSALMSKLLDDLLDVSRLTRGSVSLHRRAMKLGGALQLALDIVRAGCDTKGQTLRVHRGVDAYVWGDPVRLTQVLSNLLCNASKYTPMNGEIDVVLSADATHARVEVRDTGIGISAPLLPRIFDLFTQGKRGLSRSDGGLGLGLGIAKHLVDRHGGSLTAHSDGPGTGSTFTLALPIVPAEGPRPAAEGALVLVIDPNRIEAEALQRMLHLEGFQCEVAPDAPTGLARAIEFLPEAVFVSASLPSAAGILEQLRNTPELERCVLGWLSSGEGSSTAPESANFSFAWPISLDDVMQLRGMLKARRPAT